MNKNLKSALFIGLLFLGIIFIVMIFAPRQLLHAGYQLFPFCWSCSDEIWQIDETHAIKYRLPEGWEAEYSQTGNELLIRSNNLVDKGVNFYISRLDLDANFNEDFVGASQDRISEVFSQFKYFEVTSDPEAVDFGIYHGTKSVVYAEPHNYFSLSSSQTTELENPLYVEEYELYLIDYDGFLIQIGVGWRFGMPEINPWVYDQIQMILNSIEFE